MAEAVWAALDQVNAVATERLAEAVAVQLGLAVGTGVHGASGQSPDFNVCAALDAAFFLVTDQSFLCLDSTVRSSERFGVGRNDSVVLHADLH